MPMIKIPYQEPKQDEPWTIQLRPKPGSGSSTPSKQTEPDTSPRQPKD
jgi:hypothetical protein